MEDFVIYFDGACEWSPESGKRNPGGIATYGWVIYRNNEKFAHGYGAAAHGDGATNNVAEYTALLRALEAAKELQINVSRIYGDSQLVIRQLQGLYQVNSDRIRPLYLEVDKARSGDEELCWVKRDFNEYADSLSKRAYEQAKRDKNYEWNYRARLNGASNEP
jgi:ribonuclease HI